VPDVKHEGRVERVVNAGCGMCGAWSPLAAMAGLSRVGRGRWEPGRAWRTRGAGRARTRARGYYVHRTRVERERRMVAGGEAEVKIKLGIF
jgi:hypothetical protein